MQGLRSPFLWITALTVLVLDQLTKWWALETLGGDEPRVIDLVGSLRFRLTFNSGMAFSAGEGKGPLIALLATGIVCVMLFLIRGTTARWQLAFAGLVVGGAVGNLADRAFRPPSGFLAGHVVDFVDLQWWPVFNVADMGVVVGAVLLAIVGLREERPSDA